MAPSTAAAAATAEDDQAARRSKRVSDRNKRTELDIAGESDVKQVVNKKSKTDKARNSINSEAQKPPAQVSTRGNVLKRYESGDDEEQDKPEQGEPEKDKPEKDATKNDESDEDEREKEEPENDEPEEDEDELEEESDEEDNGFWRGAEVVVGGPGVNYNHGDDDDDDDDGTWGLSEACERVRVNHRTCKKLTLNDKLSDDDAELVGEALSENTHLDELFLNGVHSSRLTVKGVKLLTEGIKTSRITKCMLDLSHTRRVIHDAILQGLQQSKTIEELHIQAEENENTDSIDLEETLASMPSLQLASFLGDRFSLQSLAAGIRRTTSVKRLEIYRLNPCMRVLCPALAANSSITALFLQYNRLDDGDMATFVEHWSPTSPIQELNLGDNEFASRGLELLLTAALHRPALKILDLSENRKFRYAGLEYIGNEFLPRAGSSLTQLNLSFCSGHDSHAASRQRASLALINGMKANCYLQEVDVSCNDLTEAVVKEIKFYAHLNRQGRYLLRTEHGLPPSIWCHVFAKGGGNARSIFYYLTELPALVRSDNQTI